MNTLKTTIRYAVTHVGRDGLTNILTVPSDDKRMHQAYADAYNGPQIDGDISRKLGPQSIGTFEVRPIECDEHGKPWGILAAE